MKKFLNLLFFVQLSLINIAQNLYFPPNIGSTWDTLNPNSLNYCPEKITSLQNYLDETNSKAFILLKDGKIVFEWYFDTFTKDSLYVWNSAGKTLTALAVGIAQEQGFLSINDTTSSYLGQGWTSLTLEQEQKITIRNQLTMTSGLNHTGDHYCTDPSCLIYEAEPGTRWMYHNGPYTLLDNVISSATGINLNTFVQNNIRQKIGMNGFFFPVGYNNIHLSNARSMARFGLLLLANGTWNGTPVISDLNYLFEMTHPSQNLNQAYGYLTWLNGYGSYVIPSPTLPLTIQANPIPNAPMDTYAALGKNGQIINVVPSQNLVFIRMGEHDGSSLIGNEYNDSIWLKINELTCLNNLENKTENFLKIKNPVNNQIDFPFVVDEINLTDFAGKLVKHESNSNKIEISTLTKGVYFLRIINNNVEHLQKIIIE